MLYVLAIHFAAMSIADLVSRGEAATADLQASDWSCRCRSRAPLVTWVVNPPRLVTQRVSKRADQKNLIGFHNSAATRARSAPSWCRCRAEQESSTPRHRGPSVPPTNCSASMVLCHCGCSVAPPSQPRLSALEECRFIQQIEQWPPCAIAARASPSIRSALRERAFLSILAIGQTHIFQARQLWKLASAIFAMEFSSGCCSRKTQLRDPAHPDQDLRVGS